MNHNFLNKVQPAFTYLGKVIITTILFYVSSELAGNYLTFFEIFNHQEYTAYWPPSGIALGLVAIWGRSIWPGIFIGSMLRTLSASWFLQSNPEMVDSFLVISIFATGRVLESLTGRFLLKKVASLDGPFRSLKNTFYFIVIALLVALLSAGAGGLGTHFIRNDSIEVLMTRAFGWYIGNVIGILVFTPFTYAIYYQIKQKKYFMASSVVPVALITAFTVIIIYFTGFRTPPLNDVFVRTIPFLIIPLILWVSFKFNLLVTSYSVFIISLTVIYFTALNRGPFIITGVDFHYTVWLLQSFLFVISIAAITFYAASRERRENLLNLEEAKLKAEESERLKSSFLANMSHEIRTPMNAVMGFAELLSRPNLTEKKQEEFTHFILQRSKDLLAIVNDILDISKIESGQIVSKPSAGNIQELLDQSRKNLLAELNHLHTKSIEVKTFNKLKGTENLVMADFVRLQQVLSNLLNNALKFTERGSIEFGCHLQNRNTLLFYVRDTGIGIDSTNHELIFKPFQQASINTHQQYGGTGLGLAIIKGLIKLWDGNIWVESEIGKGSSFFFTIPYVLQSQPKFIEKTNPGVVNWEKFKILLVEDDTFSANYIKEILIDLPCQLTHVDSGVKALEAARQDKPSVVLLDLGLSDLHGLEVIQLLKKMYPAIAIIVITAFATADYKAKAMELGCYAFLTKPLNQNRLIQTLTSVTLDH